MYTHPQIALENEIETLEMVTFAVYVLRIEEPEKDLEKNANCALLFEFELFHSG